MTDLEIPAEVDGAPVTLALAAPLTSLRTALAEAGHPLPGGCDQGRCGSCVVLLDGAPVPACVTPAFAAAERQVSTVRTAAYPGLAEALAARGAVQCGFCLQGVIVTLSARLTAGDLQDADDVRHALDGHLCRCTGYEAFVRAACDVVTGLDSVSQPTTIRHRRDEA